MSCVRRNQIDGVYSMHVESTQHKCLFGIVNIAAVFCYTLFQ